VVAKRVKAGDVLELARRDSTAYVQYLGRHSDYGDVILVCPRLQRRRPTMNADLFRDGFVVFYPVSAAVAQGLAQVIGAMPSPGLPRRYRRAGVIDKDGRVLTWMIEDGAREELREQLTAEDRKLPVVRIWNHEMLFHSLEQGLRPEDLG
jgi:hypothetical protein